MPLGPPTPLDSQMMLLGCGSSGGGWTPALLGSKVISWISAARQTDGSQTQPVWADHSGNGRTLSNSLAARVPTLVKRGVNSSFVLDGVNNDVTGDYMISDASWSNVAAVYCLVRYRGATFTDFDCLLTSNTASPANSIILGNTASGGTAFLNLAPAPTFRKNGTTQAYTTAGSGPLNEYATLGFEWASPWTQNFRFGGQPSQPTRNWPGELVEMVVLNAAPTTDERTALETYLTALRTTTAWSSTSVAWCGTSIPTGGNSTSTGASYPHRISAMLRVNRFDNNSQGSSRAVYTGSASGATGYLSGTGANNTALGVAATGSYETKCLGYKHVIIDHGINDYNTTMGTAGTGNTDRANFAGALGYLIDAIRTADAAAKITLITPATLYALNGAILTEMTNVRQTILDVASAWSTNVIDLTTLMGYTSGSNATRFPDGTHASSLAEGEIAEALTTALLNITA